MIKIAIKIKSTGPTGSQPANEDKIKICPQCKSNITFRGYCVDCWIQKRRIRKCLL